MTGCGHDRRVFVRVCMHHEWNRRTTDPVPFGDLVVLEVVSVVGQLALLPGPLQRPFAVAVLGQDGGIGVGDSALLDVLGPLGVHAGGTVLGTRGLCRPPS